MNFKHSQTEWQIILDLYDKLKPLDFDQQQLRLSQLTISQDIIETLSAMLVENIKNNILDKPIDEISEVLFNYKKDDDLQNPEHIIGLEFGAWKVIKHLAKGGMGHVYLAQRNDGQFEKKVALKIIKSGPFSALTQEKFNSEMRTLAAFEHANISRLIDGGVNNDGISYFVMEYIDGLPITEYANINNLDLKQRITLVIQLCEAVEYAHQNLIIHGDIKPDNVLVSEKGQLKLVDFGISQPLTSQQPNLLPRFTPSYSSPEQAKGNALSTASDVFGICAVLYELCCGFAPRSGSETTSLSEYHKHLDAEIISVRNRLNNSNSQSVLTGMNFKSLSSTLNKELGTIITKGLNISPKNRYKNSTELANDLKKFISNQAVETYSKAKSYRLKKSFIRNKLTYAVSLFGFIGIFTITILALTQAQIAKAEAQKANWTSDFLINIFDKADPVKNKQNPITVNQLTDLAAQGLLNDESDYTPAVKINAMALLGDIQYKLGQAQSASEIHTKYIELLEKHSTDNYQLAKAHFDLALDYQQLGLFQPALKHFEKTQSYTPIEENVSHYGVMSLQSIAMIQIRFNQLDSAKFNLDKLLSLEDKILKSDLPNQSMMNIYIALARLSEAQENYELALNAVERTLYYFGKIPYDPILYAEIIGLKSSIFSAMNNYQMANKLGEESLKIFIEHYGKKHPETIIMLSNHASNLGKGANHEASISIYLDLIEVIKNSDMPDFFTPIMLQNLANQYKLNEQCDKAIEYYTLALPKWQNLETPRLQGQVNTYLGLTSCLISIENFEAAEKYLIQAQSFIKDTYGIKHINYAKNQLIMSSLLLNTNRLDRVPEILTNIQTIFFDTYPAQSTSIANINLKWAKYYQLTGEIIKSQQMAEKALAIFEMTKPNDSYKKLIDEAIILKNQQ